MENFKLNIKTSSPLVKVKVYDHRDDVVFNEFIKDHDLHLPKGIYTVRGEMNGHIKEETILLEKNSEPIIIEPPYFTSTPLMGAASTHDYYRQAVQHYCLHHTKKTSPGFVTPDSSILIFLRYSSIERYTSYKSNDENILYNISKTLSVLDSNKKPICIPTDWLIDNQKGFITFSAELSHGQYYLLYTGEEDARMIPLYLLKNWQTQLFINLLNRPFFPSMRLIIRKKYNSYSPSFDSEDNLINFTMDRLQNYRYKLPKDVQEALWRNKFENPILGILYAYCYLLGENYSTEENNLLNEVLRNLEMKILKTEDCPDLLLLRLLQHKKIMNNNNINKDKILTYQFTSPPMIRIGFEALLKEAITTPELVPEGSLVDVISTDYYCDSVLTSWKLSLSHITDVHLLNSIENHIWEAGEEESKTSISNNPETDHLDPFTSDSLESPTFEPKNDSVQGFNNISKKENKKEFYRMYKSVLFNKVKNIILPNQNSFLKETKNALGQNKNEPLQNKSSVSADFKNDTPSWAHLSIVKLLAKEDEKDLNDIEALSLKLGLPYNSTKRILGEITADMEVRKSLFSSLKVRSQESFSESKFMDKVSSILK